MKPKLLLIYATISNKLVAAVTFYIALNGSDNGADQSRIYTPSVPFNFIADDSGKGGFMVNWVGPGALVSRGYRITER
ncbi:hypothetical protein P154DRAFT_580768 [Amniculicola lignicola CBS 123094]|uniref:Uncharacterized protein n=1 Tax=Amniculicola lignicola CBS 123094 TaxID=1392246 RepID=A0A6A5W3S7_9PLEO|nr:hypothetical protein P154DRAFT_580768 [Amniculicola lignicola CBS 123094]